MDGDLKREVANVDSRSVASLLLLRQIQLEDLRSGRSEATPAIQDKVSSVGMRTWLW